MDDSGPGTTPSNGEANSGSTELERVQAFLRSVGRNATGLEEALALARARVAELEGQLRDARAELNGKTAQLDRVCHQLETELERRGEQVAEQTERFLNEKLAAHIDAVRTQLAKQYEARIVQLEATVSRHREEGDALRRQTETLHADLERASQAALDSRDQISREHEARLSELVAEQRGARAEESKRFEAVLTELRETLTQKDALLEQAESTTAALQREAGRLRESGEADLRALRARTAEERTELEQAAAQLRTTCSQQASTIERLESVISDSDTIQHLRDLEEEHDELRRTATEQEALVARLYAVVEAVYDLSAASPAARSILGGATSSVDLEEVTALVEES